MGHFDSFHVLGYNRIRINFLFLLATGRNCQQYCRYEYSPVCASDGRTYGNACMLKVENCLYKKNAVVVYNGKCNTKG